MLRECLQIYSLPLLGLFLFSFVKFIYSEIVSQIVSTLFIEQLNLLVIVCLTLKGNGCHIGHYCGSFA